MENTQNDVQSTNDRPPSKSYVAVGKLFDRLKESESMSKSNILKLAKEIKDVKAEHKLSESQNNRLLWGLLNKIVPDEVAK